MRGTRFGAWIMPASRRNRTRPDAEDRRLGPSRSPVALCSPERAWLDRSGLSSPNCQEPDAASQAPVHAAHDPGGNANLPGAEPPGKNRNSPDPVHLFTASRVGSFRCHESWWTHHKAPDGRTFTTWLGPMALETASGLLV